MRGIQYAAASRFDLDVSGILDRPLEPVIRPANGRTGWRAMTVGGVARLRSMNRNGFNFQTTGWV
jgi:hypothetical protein